MNVRKRTWKTPDGKKRTAYFVDYVDPVSGERRRETLKGITDKGLADKAAAKFYSELVERAHLGEAAAPTDVQKLLSLKQLLADDLKRHMAASTRRTEGHQHKALMRHLGENTPVMAITYNMLLQYQLNRLQDKVANSTVNDDMAVLRAALNRAKKARVIPRVPEMPAPLPEKEPRRRFLSPDQVEKLLDAMRKQPLCGQRDSDIVEVMYRLGGLRPCELWRMKWSDVDFEHRRITVECTKRGSSPKIRYRLLPMSDSVFKIFARWHSAYQDAIKTKNRRKTDDLVFGKKPHQRKRVCAKAEKQGCWNGIEFLGDWDLNDKIKRAARAAGLPDPDKVTPYVLRHSAATNSEGADIVDVAYMLGHSDPRTTLNIYRHVRQDRLATGLNSLERHKKGTSENHDNSETNTGKG